MAALNPAARLQVMHEVAGGRPHVPRASCGGVAVAWSLPPTACLTTAATPAFSRSSPTVPPHDDAELEQDDDADDVMPA